MVQIHMVPLPTLRAPRSPLSAMLRESLIHIGYLTAEPEKCQSFWLAHHPQDLLQLGHLLC